MRCRPLIRALAKGLERWICYRAFYIANHLGMRSCPLVGLVHIRVTPLRRCDIGDITNYKSRGSCGSLTRRLLSSIDVSRGSRVNVSDLFMRCRSKVYDLAIGQFLRSRVVLRVLRLLQHLLDNRSLMLRELLRAGCLPVCLSILHAIHRGKRLPTGLRRRY